MYSFSASNADFGQFIQETQLKPLLEKGGSAWFCTFTFKPSRNGKPLAIADEHFPKKVVVPYMLTLARELQATITPFVGWWNNGTSHHHHTHWHPVIHVDTENIEPKRIQKTILHTWKQHCNGGNLNKCVPFDLSLNGLSYVYGQHQRRDEPFFQHPFTPPIDNKTGRPLPPHSSLQGFIRSAKRTGACEAKPTRPTIIRRAKRSE